MQLRLTEIDCDESSKSSSFNDSAEYAAIAGQSDYTICSALHRDDERVVLNEDLRVYAHPSQNVKCVHSSASSKQQHEVVGFRKAH